MVAALIAGAIAIPWSRLFDAHDATTADTDLRSPDEIVRVVHFDDAGELVREITRHPHWQLQFGAAWYSCVDRGMTDVYTFGDGENITWDAIDMPRRTLALTDAERVTLLGLPAMSAHEPYGDDEYDRAEQKYIVSFGDLHAGQVNDDYSMDAPRIGASSPMGHVIDSIVNAARWRYVGERLRFLGDVRMTLDGLAEPYDHMTLALHGRAYEIRVRGRVVASDTLSEEDFVDLADWALAQWAAERPEGEAVVRASITVGDHTFRANYAWRYPRVFGPLTRAMDDVQYELSQER